MDLLLFVLFALFMGWRLYTVLGTRTGNERNPEDFKHIYERPETRDPARRNLDVVIGEDSDAPLTLSGAIAQIKIADPYFDEKKFLRGARGAFELILKAFADGDKQQLKELLSPAAYANFAGAIDARKANGERLETTLVRLRDPDITDAKIAGGDAFITVTYKSEQISATKDKHGKLIDGDPDRIFDVTDIWTFTRKLRAEKPTWYLSETSTDA